MSNNFTDFNKELNDDLFNKISSSNYATSNCPTSNYVTSNYATSNYVTSSMDSYRFRPKFTFH